jgi:hypothetical protein
MKKLIGFSLWLFICTCNFATTFAQESTDQMKPPNVLVIMREFLKPGKGGSTHEKSEGAFVKAMTDAKWPTHYFGADSLSGRSRSLFFVRYDSLADWEKDNQAMMKNPTLSAGLDSASQADGELLDEYDTSVSTYREDLSLRAAGVNIAQMRYFEISRFVVRPGHGQEWDTLVKQYKSAYEKAVPDARWAVFESMYGTDNGGVFLVFVPMKSLAEADRSISDAKKFVAAIGESEMKKLTDLEAACVESRQTNLFAFNPKISYPPDAWVKADPDFWSAK